MSIREPSLADLSKLVGGLPYALLVRRGETIVYTNEAAARLFGATSPAALTGRSASDLFTGVSEIRTLTGAALSVGFEAYDTEWEGAPATLLILEGAGAKESEARLRHELEERLAQNDRVSALGRAAATIAHEMRNVLMAINPYAEIVARRATDGRMLDAAQRIQEVVRRGKRVTEEILAFTRRSDPILVPLNVCEWLAMLRVEIEHAVGGGIEVEMDIDECDLWIDGDASELNTAMMNLVLNARDAMAASGRLLIIVTRSDNGRIEVSLRDTGPGVPPDLLPRLFEPFFTTKHRGTGLGLAMVERIITQHGGWITARNEGGAVFTFSLPAVTRTPPEGVLRVNDQRS